MTIDTARSELFVQGALLRGGGIMLRKKGWRYAQSTPRSRVAPPGGELRNASEGVAAFNKAAAIHWLRWMQLTDHQVVKKRLWRWPGSR